MIKSFVNDAVGGWYRGLAKCPRSIKAFEKIAIRKLAMIDAATRVEYLRVPPNNRLKRIRGKNNVWQIRINDQYRVRFIWKDGHAFDIDIGDFH
jgi:toxin HigB-1